MSSQLRYIVERLNGPPFARRYNLVSFDSLDPQALLQVLNDVLAEISPEHKMDLREEPPDQTAFRIFSLLRVLKYKPKADEGGGLNAFRHGLLSGEKATVYPLLQWLLERTEELKKRAYLAKYLVKIDVPPEYLQEEGAVEMHDTYQELVDQFKELHRTVEQQRSSQFSVADVRKDISVLEEEKELLIKRIERLRKRVAELPMQTEMLEAARKLRHERDRELSLGEQRTQQKNQLLHTQQRLSRLQDQLEEARSSAMGLTPHTLLAKLGEENHVKSILVRETLPRSIENKRKECIELERVVTEPITTDADLDAVREEIEAANAEISELMEKHMPGGDPLQDKLILYRQQAAMVTHKKQAEAERYKEALDELAGCEADLKEKEAQVSSQMKGHGEVVREEEFKRIVAKMRPMHKTYQKKKGDLSLLKAESGVLARTEEILRSRDENTQELIALLEERKGVRGYVQAQETLEQVSAAKSELDEQKEVKLKEMTQTIEALTAAIRSKKESLAPLLKEVRPVRQQHKELQAAHAEKKTTYDAVYVGLEAKRSQLESEAQQLWEEKTAHESRYHYLHALKQSVELQQQKVAAEMKCYTSSGKAGDKSRKSLRDQYTRKILEQESLGRALRDKQKDVRGNHEHNLKQVKMWQNLRSLLQAKQESHEARAREKEEEKMAQQAMIHNPDRLVLS